MERLSLTTVLGRLHVVAASEALARAALEPLLAAALDRASVSRPVELQGRAGWLKGGPPRGSAALRYGLRWRLARRAPPRGRELANLDWLRARLFRAPEPLFAGWIVRGAQLRYQALVSARIADAQRLDEALERSLARERRELVDELAREVARLHALRFVHHDLYLRNVLVTRPHAGEGDPRRLVFVDAWRGGPYEPWRDAAYDLGCLMLEGASVLREDEQRALVAAYLEERAAQGRPADAPLLLAAATRERARQLARVRRQPARWRGAGEPAPEWDATSLAR